MLLDHRRYDNAGYHFGLAAECAVKGALLRCRVPPGDPVIQKLHFPSLRLAALQAIQGRSAARVRSLLKDQVYLQRWDIAMRYAANGSVPEHTARRWRDQANSALSELLIT
jgi:hypothetical protein